MIREEVESQHRRRRLSHQQAWRPSRRAMLITSALGTSAVLLGGCDDSIRTFSGHTDQVTSVAISADGHTGLSGSRDKTVRLWDLATGGLIKSIAGHTGVVTSIAVGPDSGTALSGSLDNTRKLWDLTHGASIWTKNDAPKTASAVAIVPHGETALAALNGDGTYLVLSNLTDGSPIRQWETHQSYLDCAVVALDGRSALSAGVDGRIILWDLETGREIRSFSLPWIHASGSTYPSPNATMSVAFAPDGRTALSGNVDKTLTLWNLATGDVIRTFTGAGYVNCVAFLPDGGTALSGSDDSTLKLWDIAAGKAIRTFSGHYAPVTSLAIASDGRTALSGSKDNTLKLWQLS